MTRKRRATRADEDKPIFSVWLLGAVGLWRWPADAYARVQTRERVITFRSVATDLGLVNDVFDQHTVVVDLQFVGESPISAVIAQCG